MGLGGFYLGDLVLLPPPLLLVLPDGLQPRVPADLICQRRGVKLGQLTKPSGSVETYMRSFTQQQRRFFLRPAGLIYESNTRPNCETKPTHNLHTWSAVWYYFTADEKVGVRTQALSAPERYLLSFLHSREMLVVVKKMLRC